MKINRYTKQIRQKGWNKTKNCHNQTKLQILYCTKLGIEPSIPGLESICHNCRKEHFPEKFADSNTGNKKNNELTEPEKTVECDADKSIDILNAIKHVCDWRKQRTVAMKIDGIEKELRKDTGSLDTIIPQTKKKRKKIITDKQK